jgi:hypothetical protein
MTIFGSEDHGDKEETPLLRSGIFSSIISHVLSAFGKSLSECKFLSSKKSFFAFESD